MTKSDPPPTGDEAIELLLDTLSDVIGQACYSDDGTLDSQALSAYATGLRVLAQFGRVGIVDEYGRWVSAVWPDEDLPG